MAYTYKNITKISQLLTLPSPQRNTVSHIHLAPNATIDLAYPGLDMYMPHILARMEGTTNVTHIVLRQNDNAKAAIQAASTPKTATPSPAAVSQPARIAGNPTAVKPGVYVAKEPATTKPVVAVVPSAAPDTTVKDTTPIVVEPTITPVEPVVAPATSAPIDKEALLAELKDVEAKLTKE